MNVDCEIRDAGYRAKEKQGGFSLIETVITLIVLSIAAVAIISVFSTGIKGSANPLVAAQATQLAQGELDTVIGIRIAGGFSGAGLATGTGQTCKTPAGAMLPGFNCSLDICFVPVGNLNDTTACGTATSYKRVAVTITNATIGSIIAETLLTNY